MYLYRFMKHTKRPLTVLFDANPLAAHTKSGVGYYTSQLIAALAAIYPDNLRLIGHYYNFLGRKHDLDLPRAPNIHYCETRLLPGKIFNGLRRFLGVEIPIEILARRRGNVLFFPNFALSPSLFRRPRVAVIHDLYFTVAPEHINPNNLDFLQKFVPKAAEHATRIFTVSAFTKRAVRDTYHIAAEKILVTPIPPELPLPLSPSAVAEMLGDIGIHGKYLLFVGNIEPRKNLPNLIRAYGLLPERWRDTYSLVLAGGKGWQDAAILQAIESARQNGAAIITPGYVSDTQKSALYRGASALVLPSQYEGFGMQLLEAMSYDCPVAASDIPVFHEVGGDAILYFDYTDPKDIAMHLEQVTTDSALQARLVAAGKRQVKKYDWQTVAKDVYEVFKELADD